MAGMSNFLKFCSCRQCRHGLHHYRGSKAQARRVVRRARHQARDNLRRYGVEADPPRVFSVGYTD